MAYYNYSKSYLESMLAEYKELKNIEKELNELSKENKLANNYDLYEQYMSKIQTYYFDENIEYAKIYASTKEELIEKTREYLKDIYGLDGYELLEYEEALQKAYINFIGQGYYQIYNSIGCSGDISVHRIDEMLKIALSSAMMKYEFDDEVWEYICEHCNDI